jgi:hypothetical protein
LEVLDVSQVHHHNLQVPIHSQGVPMLRVLLFLTTLSLLVVQPARADDDHGYAVGSCKPRLTRFSSISAAVSSVPPGSTIFICPGTYPEQVTISQPLTLKGITSANQDDAIVTVPSGGLSTNASSIFGEGIAAQILVQTAGPVEIINLSVDGTGSDNACAGGVWVAGIFYAIGSSGEVHRARTSQQMNSGCSAGIWAENDGITNQSIEISDSSVHDIGNTGIFVAQNGGTPTFLARVHGNTVSVPNGMVGIAMAGVSGTASGNVVSNALFGIADVGPQISLNSNDVSLSGAGILLEGGGQVFANRISTVGVGVLFFANGGSLRENRIVRSTEAAVEFACFTGSARDNAISDAPVGLDQETSLFDPFNSFDNTGMISTGGCVAPLAPLAPIQGAAVGTGRGNDSLWQWRTPGSPSGAAQ